MTRLSRDDRLLLMMVLARVEGVASVLVFVRS